MIQKNIFNISLLSLLISFSIYWKISQDTRKAISTNTFNLRTFLSYNFVFNLFNYMLFESFSNCHLNGIHATEEFLNSRYVDRKTCHLVMDFIRQECVRAGHPDPEKIRLFIDSTEDEKHTFDFSLFPSNAKAFIGLKYHVIILSEYEVLGLLQVFDYKNDIANFRKSLFLARAELDLPFEGQKNNNFNDYLNSIFFCVVDAHYISNMHAVETGCEIDYEIYIQQLEAELPKSLPHSKTLNEQEELIKDLKIIACASKEYLDECLDEILAMWAAAIHHEASHLQETIHSFDLNLISKGYVALAGISPGSLLFKLYCYIQCWSNEVAADNNIVEEEKYLKGAYMFFYYFHYLEEFTLKESYEKGIWPYINHLFERLMDVHPTYLTRAKNCIYRIQRLRERKNGKEQIPQNSVSFFNKFFYKDYEIYSLNSVDSDPVELPE